MNNSLFKISAIINETSKIIIDLDYDFFFDSEDHISSNPWKAEN